MSKNLHPDFIPSLLTLARTVRKASVTQGIGMGQLCALEIVSKNPGCSMTNIAHALSIGASTATTVVLPLVRTGLLSRIHDGSNRRKVLLQLTPKGKRTLLSILKGRDVKLKKSFEHFPKQFQLQLVRLAHSLYSE